MHDKENKKVLEQSNHFKQLDFQESSVRSVTKKAYIHHVGSDVFIGLVTALLFFLYLVILHNDVVSKYVPEYLQFVVLIIFLVLSFFIAKKLSQRIQNYKYSLAIQLSINCLIILYFVYQVFTPYFFSDQYLINYGLEKVEQSYMIDDRDLSEKEREELAYDTFVKSLAFANINLFYFSDTNIADSQLLSHEVIDLERQFNRYKIVLEVKEKVDGSVFDTSSTFTFKKEGGKFKIIGTSNN